MSWSHTLLDVRLKHVRALRAQGESLADLADLAATFGRSTATICRCCDDSSTSLRHCANHTN